MNRMNLIYENCVCCNKAIRAGHPFIICHNCDCILHKKCKTKENIINFRNKTYCKSCADKNDIVRYNPFYQPPHFANNGPFEDEPTDYIDSINMTSSILENCQSFSIKQLNLNILPKNLENYFSTLFLNIDGNATNFDEFAVQMSSIHHKFSVIGLSETNTDCNNGNLYQLRNYSSCYQSRFSCDSQNKIKAKGSGVCLYVHNSFNYSEIKKLSLCKENIETLFITITNTAEPIIVGVVYRPPNCSLIEFNKEYEDIISELNGKKAYILGDYNIDLLKLSSPQEDKFQEVIFSCGLTPTISIPTHQMPHCARTCIDNIHTNDIDVTTISGVISDKISHHHPVFVMKKLAADANTEQETHPEKITIHYDYSNANLDKLCEEIEKDIDMINHCDTFESFLTTFQEKIDNTCKLLTPKTTKRNSITNPWITQGLTNSIEKKARLYFEWRKTCTIENPEGNVNRHAHYTKFNRFLKNAVKIAKATHYANQFEKHSSNSKKTWEIINELRGKTKVSVKDDFVIDGRRVTCRRIIANKFNEYFTSLASNLNEQVLSNDSLYVLSNDSLYVQPLESFVQYMANSVDSSIYLEDTQPEEITKIIMELKNGKASDIPISVLKRPAHLISSILARLYNNCMQCGTFPTVFKTGKVIPIYKKDNKECIENYRPVSILPIFGKIFEKIIYKRLYAFFVSKGVLNDAQFGFRKGHSTTHALHKSVDSITKSLADHKHVLGIFIDLSKAFDTLDHQILLKKLENYGIRGNAHSLLQSYLSNRNQYVSFKNTSSDTLSLKYGVPQGSILGPLLFLLYMNDLVNCFSDPNIKFVLYADDTNIFISGPSQESTYLKANEVLEHISKFMRCNLLHINMSKCCYIHFKPQYELDETCARVRPFADQHDKSRAIFINGEIIPKVSSTKFLGIIIDEKLNWDPHIKYLAHKLRSITGAICRIRHSIPADLYLKLYNALFESHLTYGISVWGVALKDKSDDKLFITQKHCMRILFGDLDAYLEKQSTCARTRPYGQQKLGPKYYQKEHTKPIFNRLKILTVQGLFKYHCILELFKIMKFKSPYSLYEITNMSKRDTSHTIILSKKTNTFLYKASTLWNAIYKRVLDLCTGLDTSVNLVKIRSRTILLGAQASDMNDQWTPNNFQIPSSTLVNTLGSSTSAENMEHIDEIITVV